MRIQLHDYLNNAFNVDIFKSTDKVQKILKTKDNTMNDIIPETYIDFFQIPITTKKIRKPLLNIPKDIPNYVSLSQ